VRAGFLRLQVSPLLALSTAPANAQEWQTSSTLNGVSKYGQDFKQYDYVNPNAPKGGTLNSTTPGTFDSFNPYIVKGLPAAGLVALWRRTDL
jgi:microcin C transport system substrate-binding protein